MRPRRWLWPIRRRISRNNCLKHKMCSNSYLLHLQVSALVLGMSIFFSAWAWRWWVAGPIPHHCPGQQTGKKHQARLQTHREYPLKLPEHSGRLAALSLGGTGVLLLVLGPRLTGTSAEPDWEKIGDTFPAPIIFSRPQHTLFLLTCISQYCANLRPPDRLPSMLHRHRNPLSSGSNGGEDSSGY
jgi:hypothetical protein